MTRLPTPIVNATSAAIFTAVIASPRQVRLRRCEQRRQEHQRDDGEQILDDEPSDGDVPGWRMQVAVVRQNANEHHGAGNGQRHAEDDAGRPAPSERRRDHRAQDRGNGALRDRTRYRHATDRQQFLDVKLQADAEHQEDDADLRELFRDLRVRNEPGRVGADQDAGKQVADERRQPESLRDIPEQQCGAEATCEREDQIEVVHSRRDERWCGIAIASAPRWLDRPVIGRFGRPAPVSRPFPPPGGSIGVSPGEFGVHGVQRVAEALRRDQQTQLGPTEHSACRRFGSGIEGIEGLPNRGRESICRTPIGAARPV